MANVFFSVQIQKDNKVIKELIDGRSLSKNNYW